MRMLCGHLELKNTDAQWASEVKKHGCFVPVAIRMLKWASEVKNEQPEGTLRKEHLIQKQVEGHIYEDPSSDKTGRRLQC